MHSANSRAPSLEIRPALLADHPTPMRGVDRASEGSTFLQQQQQHLRKPPRRNVSAIGSLLYSSALAAAAGGAASAAAAAAAAGGAGGGGLLMLPLPSAMLQMEAHRLRRGGAAAAVFSHTEPVTDGPKPVRSSARQLSGAAMGEPSVWQQGPGAATTAAVVRRSRLVSRTASFYLTVPSQLLLQPRRSSLSGAGSATSGVTPTSELAAVEAAPPSPSNLSRRGARRLSERLSVTQRRLSALSSPLSRSKTSTTLGMDSTAAHGSVPLPTPYHRASPVPITSASTASPPSGSPFFQMLGLIRQQVEAQAGGAMRLSDPVIGVMEARESRS